MNLPIAFGKYLLTERIATGGMAEVFKAKSFGIAGFEKIVAIKRIYPHLSLDQEFVNMFIDEARIASALSHPGIVQIFDLGKIEDTYFIAMEYVDGITLEKYIHSEEISQTEKLMLSCYIIKEISRALHYAHTKKAPDGTPMNIVHRDISAQNVLLSEEGMVKITDFGVAKARLRLSRTEPGMTKGKYPYMSPEQVLGKEVDHRSDIFSLSVLFYELLTGKQAFDGETEFEIMESIQKCEYQLPRKVNKFIPEELEQIIIKGMQRNPLQRFNSAEEISSSLSEFLLKNKFTEPQESLKKIVKKIIGRNIDEPEDKVNISTVVLAKRKNSKIKKLFIPGIIGIIILSFIIYSQSKEGKAEKIQRTLTSLTNNYSVTITQSNQSEEQNKPGTKQINEQKITDVKVKINTVPWSYVYIGGKKIGETPLSGIVLTPGEHQFTFENPQLNLHVTKTIKIETGSEKTIFVDLRK